MSISRAGGPIRRVAIGLGKGVRANPEPIRRPVTPSRGVDPGKPADLPMPPQGPPNPPPKPPKGK